MRKIVFILCLFALCACNRITEGEVIDRCFTPAHSRVHVIPLIISNGKTTTTIMVPYIYHYPDTWSVVIKGEHNGKDKTRRIYVNQSVFESTHLGAQFVYQKGRDLVEQPYSREKQ